MGQRGWRRPLFRTGRQVHDQRLRPELRQRLLRLVQGLGFRADMQGGIPLQQAPDAGPDHGMRFQKKNVRPPLHTARHSAVFRPSAPSGGSPILASGES